MKRYGIEDDDFGFSTLDDEQIIKDNSRHDEALMIANIVLPLLKKLRDSKGDYIHWPDRKEKLNEKIDQIADILAKNNGLH